MPFPGSTQIRPLWRSMMRLQIARPMPVPGNSRPWKRLKIPKMRSEYCGSIPIPLSLTQMVHSS